LPEGDFVISQRIDTDLLARFEQGLDPKHPENSTIPARILGYGEISTIFEILHDSQSGLAFKRMPIFETEDEMDRYERLFLEYNKVLSKDINIIVPDHASARIYPKTGNMVIYNIQEKLPPESFCHKLIHKIDVGSSVKLLLVILRRFKQVWEYNVKGGPIVMGLDGQLSNWAVKDYDPAHTSITEESELYYIDTSTPLMRIQGIEQIEADLFLRSAPSFLIWLIKAFFLQGVLDRYYNFHLVVVDLIANLYKEQRPDLIPSFIDAANAFFEHDVAHLGPKSITAQEVKSYYREDAFIFGLFLALRKLDCFITTRILRKPYPYILPGKITR
jgi:hypothetical protein